MRKILIPIAIIGLLATACGGAESTETEQTAVEETTPAVEEVAAVAEVTIEANDQMKYNLDRIDVKEGQTVRLTLKHVGTLPVEAMGHNWVLVKQGTDKEAFAAAAMTAKETGYIPAAFADNIIAHTDMIGGGATTTIEFAAPAKGFYSFFCSFPGHMGFMKGTFYVN
jgi:azurin